MRAGGELRGNSIDRWYRKSWLMRTFGNGLSAPCMLRITDRCLRRVDWDTITADRIIPGARGGRYVHGNLIPACIYCNRHRGDKELRQVMSRRRVETLLRKVEEAGT